MPAKPVWSSHLDRTIEELRALPRLFVDRATVEFLLGVARRRAKQIIAPGLTDRVGTRVLSAVILFAGLAVQSTLGNSTVLTTVSAASFRGPAVAPGSIAAAFGLDLATSTETATSMPLPESLSGTSVKVTDSAGAVRTAPLLFVSPGQINYLIPEGTAEGPAVITVERTGVIQTGSATVRNAVPGVFSANADGQGVAAAIATRAAGDKILETSPVYRFDAAQSKHVPAPIEMGPDSHRVFLSLYGTGIRHATVVSATILGRSAPVSWRGAHSVYPGLDQVNIEIPRSLLGRGPLSVRLTADGMEANPVAIELRSPTYLNLDYETSSGGRVWSWLTKSAGGYEYTIDSSVAYSGTQSLRIRYVNAATNAFGNTYLSLPAGETRGKHVRFSSYIKAEGMTRGAPGLWLRVDGTTEALSIDNAFVQTAIAGWQLCTIEREVSPEAAQIVLGVLQTGDGAAWFDKMSLEIDGAPFPEARAPVIGEPSAAQLDWVRGTAIPLSTPDAGNGFDDLEGVRDIVGDARIVALGEATHGTSEFFRTKHRLLEFLATRMGFTIFAIEANMPEAYRLNEYVLTGRGDPKKLMAGMYFWTWNTQEVLDMILWMRQFNASGMGRIQFTGFDMQTATVAMEIVRDFVLRAEPAYLPSVDAAWSQARAVSSSAPVSQVQEAAAAVRAVWRHLDDNRSAYSGFANTDVEWAIQNGKIVEQATYVKIAGTNYRDISMAANMEWILKQNPGARAVVWAHNAHVSRMPGWMGSYLDQTFGENYRVFGFVFHEGRYNAFNQYPGGSLTSNVATPSFPGSVEYAFLSAGIPQFIVDLRKAEATDAASAWLLGEIQYRDIGSVAGDGFRSTNRLAADFDALIYFERTTPSQLLPF